MIAADKSGRRRLPCLYTAPYRGKAAWSSLAAGHRPSPRSATGSTRSMPITPALRVHGSPPRRVCWPWLRGAGGKRRVKLGLSDSEATLSQASRITDGSEGGSAGLDHHAARRLQTTNVKAQRCYLRMRPHTPCINSSNAPLVAPLDHLAGTRTFHRHQHHHTPSHVQHRPLFRCGDGTFNFKDSQPL